MHRPPLCGVMCACVLFPRVSFCFSVSVCAQCGLTAAPLCSPTCQPSQTQPGLTETGERVSLAHSCHATPPLHTYGGGKNMLGDQGERNLCRLFKDKTGSHLFVCFWLMIKLKGSKKTRKVASIFIYGQLSSNASTRCAWNTDKQHIN